MIIAFNQEREATYGDYQKGKTIRKEEEEKAGTKKDKPQYNKLYKHLGNDNRNKDVRQQLQDEVDMYTDNQLSTNMTMNQIPGYTMNKHNQTSTFKDSYKGKADEPVDKIYFRQKDEIN